MKKVLYFTLILLSFSIMSKENPRVIIKTNFDDIEVELFESKSPISVKNFLQYVDSKFYDKTIFHRVMETFMIQGGGFTTDLKRKSTRAAIQNEASNGIPNDVGTLSMARTADPDSATAQFFINVTNNSYLNYQNSSKSGAGYAVFGKVVKGMSVINRIKKVKTIVNLPFRKLPAEHVIIKSIRRK